MINPDCNARAPFYHDVMIMSGYQRLYKSMHLVELRCLVKLLLWYSHLHI